MIFKLLDAYEQEIEKEYSFWEKVKQLARWKKVVFILMICVWVGTVPVFFLTKDTAILTGYMVGCAVVCWVAEESLKVDKRKKYVENLNAYNQRLDKLQTLLNEKFAIDSPIKLEVTIKKCNSYLEQTQIYDSEKKQSRNNVFNNIIFPLGAFMLGRLASEMNSMEVVAYGIVLLIILFCTKFTINQAVETIKTIYETTPVKMRYLVEQLQDVYDRDYIDL